MQSEGAERAEGDGADHGSAAGAGREERLPTSQLLGYSLPALGAAVIPLSIALYLPNYYTDELGLTAGTLSWVFLFGRIWDAVTDPLMGHISDRTRTRFGRRRPYFLLAALPLWLFFYLIWSPPATLRNGSELFLYLLLCYLLLYTFWTIFWIPYVSLGMEMTPAYHERTRLFGWRQAAFLVGTAAAMLAPEFFARHAGDAATGYARMALLFGGLAAGLMLLAFFRLRERPVEEHGETVPFFEGLALSFRNRAFVVLVGVYLIAVIGGSFIAPLTLYVGKYVIRARWVVPYVMLAYLAGSVLSIPLWVRLAGQRGKNWTWKLATGVAVFGYAYTWTYHEGSWLRWIVMAAMAGAISGCTLTLGPSLIADVIDSDELTTGHRREGAFMGIWSFIDKAAVGIAVFAGLQGLEAIGYAPNVVQPPAVIRGIKFLYCLLPAVCYALSLLLFLRFPITREVHAEIRRELAERHARRTTPGRDGPS